MPRSPCGRRIVLGLLAAHDLTHLLDDGLDTSPGQLALVAIPQWIALGVVMAIVLRGDETHRPMAALALGVSVVLGFALVHLLPIAPDRVLGPAAVGRVLGPRLGDPGRRAPADRARLAARAQRPRPGLRRLTASPGQSTCRS